MTGLCSHPGRLSDSIAAMRRRPGAIPSPLLLASLVPATRVDAAPSRANLQREVDSLTTQISTLDEDYNDAMIKLSQAERQMRELGIAKKRSALQQRVHQHEALMARVANEERARAAAAARSRNAPPLAPLLRPDPIHHVGMYVGGGNMIDASTYGKPVAVRSMLRSGYVGAGRPGV